MSITGVLANEPMCSMDKCNSRMGYWRRRERVVSGENVTSRQKSRYGGAETSRETVAAGFSLRWGDRRLKPTTSAVSMLEIRVRAGSVSDGFAEEIRRLRFRLVKPNPKF